MKFEGIRLFGRFFAKAKNWLKRHTGSFFDKPRSHSSGHIAHWAKEIVMKKSTLRFGAIVASLVLVIGLAACGGGGGSPTPPVICTAPQVNVNGVCTTPTADTTAPTLMLATTSPASLTTTISVTANEDLGGNVAIVVKNGVTTVSGTTALQPGNRGMTWTPSSALTCNTVYTVTASANDLTGNTGTMTGTITTVGCPVATYWNPLPAFIPMGVKIAGSSAVRVPLDCTTITQQCWKDLVASGAIKLLATSQKMTGCTTAIGCDPNRAVVIAFYLDNYVDSGQNGLYHMLLLFADTGEKVGGRDVGGSGLLVDVDWIMGNDRGVIFYDKRTAQCIQFKWNPPTTQTGVSSGTWDYAVESCQ